MNTDAPGHVVPAEAGVSESSASAVSWGAIVGGGFAAAGLSLVLAAFGAGAGLSSISPWAGAASTTFKVSVGIYFIVTAVLASSVGGYLAGRLRTRWIGAHTREVFFRDTAHGFLTWAFATVLSLALLATPVAALVGGAATALSRTAGQTTGVLDTSIDELLRPAAGMSLNTADMVAWRAEVGRVFSSTFQSGQDFSAVDRAYLAQIVVARTGLDRAQAEQRVSTLVAQARQTADKVRKAAAQLSLWLAASLLAGALSASLAAIEGGALRDGTWHYKV
jgi:hypothetical protein